MPQNLGEVLACVEDPVALGDLRMTCLGVAVSFHVIRLLCPPFCAIGLSHVLDHVYGIPSSCWPAA